MFQAPPREKEAVSWLYAALWAVAIFCTVPFARKIQDWFNQHLGHASLQWITVAFIVVAAVLLLIHLVRGLRRMPWARIATLVAIAGVFLLGTFKLTSTPSEAIHFVEYGILSILIFRALSHRQHDPLIYLNVLLIGALVSTTDEILQWFTPGRYWDPRDLSHNALAIVLVQIGLAVGFVPPFIKSAIRPASIRCATILVAAQALLFGCCASNTPYAAAKISKQLPALTFLLDNEQAMSEYGWRHEDPDHLRFYSRFDRDDLIWVDKERGAEVGAIIEAHKAPAAYKRFLAVYTPARDPFAHEAMVHLFRRNHYFTVLPKYRFDPASYAFHANVAYRENQILERYFSNTLAHTSFQWTEELDEALKANAQLDRRYTSEVSENLIHRFTERGIWMIIFCVLLVDAFIFIRWGKPRWSPPARDWGPVVLWTLLIYCLIPFARAIQHWVAAHFGITAFLWIVAGAIVAGAIGAVAYLRRHVGVITRHQGLVLAGMFILYGATAWALRRRPEEALHLVEYGILSLLLFRAFSRRYPDRGAYVVSTLLGSILGIGDEIVQWALPGRYFDFRDIGINVLAVAVMQLGLAVGLAPALCGKPFGVRSARTAWRQTRLILILLFGIASNTPDLWRMFYVYRPDLFIFEEVMTEYGYLHTDAGVGTFKSRLTKEDLQSADELRAKDVASKMNRFGRDAQYDFFLRRYTPISDPFVHEFRVRLFRRDRNYQFSRDSQHSPSENTRLATIAFREQQLLEHWFGHSMRESGRDWSPDRRAEMEARARPGVYHSPVSNQIITWCTEAQAQIVLGTLVLVVIIVGRYDVARRKRRDRRVSAL